VRSDIVGDLGAFFHIAAGDDVGRRRANAIGLLKAAIAAIEARDHLLAAGSTWRFGVDQRLCNAFASQLRIFPYCNGRDQLGRLRIQ
jgi:hypothetical protein